MMVDPPRKDSVLERLDFLRRHRILLVGLGRLKRVSNGRRPAERVRAMDDHVDGEASRRTRVQLAAVGRGHLKRLADLVPGDAPLAEPGEEHRRLRRREVARFHGARNDRGHPGGRVGIGGRNFSSTAGIDSCSAWRRVSRSHCLACRLPRSAILQRAIVVTQVRNEHSPRNPP